MHIFICKFQFSWIIKNLYREAFTLAISLKISSHIIDFVFYILQAPSEIPASWCAPFYNVLYQKKIVNTHTRLQRFDQLLARA